MAAGSPGSSDSPPPDTVAVAVVATSSRVFVTLTVSREVDCIDVHYGFAARGAPGATRGAARTAWAAVVGFFNPVARVVANGVGRGGYRDVTSGESSASAADLATCLPLVCVAQALAVRLPPAGLLEGAPAEVLELAGEDTRLLGPPFDDDAIGSSPERRREIFATDDAASLQNYAFLPGLEYVFTLPTLPYGCRTDTSVAFLGEFETIESEIVDFSAGERVVAVWRTLS